MTHILLLLHARRPILPRTYTPDSDKGIVPAGLDIIGGYLTEIKITSPTGLRKLSAGCGEDLATRLMQLIISRTSQPTTDRRQPVLD